MSHALSPVRAELVEAPSFFSALRKKGQGFDKLSPNGVGFARNQEVLV